MRNDRMSQIPEPGQATFSDVYQSILFPMMHNNPRIILGEADLGRAMFGAAYADLKKKYPNQMFDVGIQEANLVGVASGLSVVGRIPVIHSFAAFITRRVYDTLFVSGAYAKLNMKLIGSDPGITSTYNGGTHMTFEDIGLINSIPDAVIFEPADIASLQGLLPQLLDMSGICYIRMPRKIKPVALYSDGAKFEVGKAMQLRDGGDATVIALGTEVVEAVKAAQLLETEGIHIRVLDAVTVKPLDETAVIRASRETGAVVVAENHNIKTGLFASVCETLAQSAPCIAGAVGVKDEFGEVGNYDELLHRFHLAAEDIAAEVKSCISAKHRS